jgi:hypothetical protein
VVWITINYVVILCGILLCQSYSFIIRKFSEMNYPKKLKMFGYVWKVIISKDERKEHGGNFKWDNRTITINDRYGEWKAILLHEIIEAVLVHNLSRYYGNEGNTEYHFFFNHTQFVKIAYDLFQVLEENEF